MTIDGYEVTIATTEAGQPTLAHARTNGRVRATYNPHQDSPGLRSDDWKRAYSAARRGFQAAVAMGVG